MFDTARTAMRAATAAAAALCLASALACGGNDADDTMAMDTTGAMRADSTAAMAPAGGMSDAQIMAAIRGANTKEIAAANMARDNAASADVKKFAADIIDDHQKLMAGGDSLGQAIGVTPQPAVPDTIETAIQQMRTQLEQTTGAAFDRMYMDAQVRDHEAVVQLLNTAATTAQHAELRTMIQNAMPIIQRHLDRARQIRSGLGG